MIVRKNICKTTQFTDSEILYARKYMHTQNIRKVNLVIATRKRPKYLVNKKKIDIVLVRNTGNNNPDKLNCQDKYVKFLKSSWKAAIKKDTCQWFEFYQANDFCILDINLQFSRCLYTTIACG